MYRRIPDSLSIVTWSVLECNIRDKQAVYLEEVGDGYTVDVPFVMRVFSIAFVVVISHFFLLSVIVLWLDHKPTSAIHSFTPSQQRGMSWRLTVTPKGGDTRTIYSYE